MALSKEWKERYERELKATVERFAQLSKTFPGWDFKPPKTMPKSDYQAAERITKFKRISQYNIEVGSAPEYVRRNADLSFYIPPVGASRGKTVKAKSAPLTSKQYLRAKRAGERQIEVYRELGIEYEPRPFTDFAHKSSVDKYIKLRRSKKVIMQNALDKAELFKKNFIKSTQSQEEAYLSYGMEDNADLIYKIRLKVREMNAIEVANILTRLQNMDVSMQLELLGSEKNVLSESNLHKVAQAFGVDFEVKQEDPDFVYLSDYDDEGEDVF